MFRLRFQLLLASLLLASFLVFASLTLYPTREVSAVALNSSSLITNIESEWHFDVVKLDELNANITQINETAFVVTPFSVNSTITDKKDYKWKLVTNFTSPETKQEVKNTLVSNQPKAELNKGFVITLPSKDITQFTIKLGETSTLIDASADSLATTPPATENICRTSDGKLHAAWEGGSSDLWYGNSTDNGATWTARELSGDPTQRVGILCLPNDDIFVYYIDTGEATLEAINSTDGGATFGSSRTLIMPIGTLHWGSCASDSDSNVHCCGFDSSDDLWWGNSSDGSGDEISSSDSDHCDVAFNSTGGLYLVVTDSSGDDIDYMSYVNGDWSSRYQIHGSLGTVDYNDDNDLSIYIDDDDVIHIASIHTDDLQYCKGNPGSWSCQELDSSSSFAPSITVTDIGDVHILYSGSEGSTGTIYRANSSDGGSNWVARTTLHSPGGWASTLGTKFPAWNNISGTMQYLYRNVTGLVYQTYEVNTSVGGVDPCACPGVDENWEIDHSDACTISTGCDLGTGNLTFTGSGTTTCDAHINTSDMGDPGVGGLLLMQDDCFIKVG